jgi:hypothetical protein
MLQQALAGSGAVTATREEATSQASQALFKGDFVLFRMSHQPSSTWPQLVKGVMTRQLCSQPHST